MLQFQKSRRASLYVPILSCMLCLPAAGLGLGQTRHTAPLPDGEPHRKGISCERTFKPMHLKSDLEAMVGVPWMYGDLDAILAAFAWGSAACIFLDIPPLRVCYIVQASSLVTSLCSDMASEGIEGRTLTLKLKLTSFEVRTRATTLSRHVSQPDQLLSAALK